MTEQKPNRYKDIRQNLVISEGTKITLEQIRIAYKLAQRGPTSIRQTRTGIKITLMSSHEPTQRVLLVNPQEEGLLCQLQKRKNPGKYRIRPF